MLEDLLAAWRARRVLIAGGTGRSAHFMQAFLDTLGAKTTHIAPDADSETLFRALSSGRIHAVIVLQPDAFSPCGDAVRQLEAFHRLLFEMREAGVPLLILCSDASIYRASNRPVREGDPIGGETPSGFTASLLERYADGLSRGLAGDAVHAILVRHPPALGCGHDAVSLFSHWCHALDKGLPLPVLNPAQQSAFIHPCDVCCGALLLGARFFLHGFSCTGTFNLGAGKANVMTNRRAALRFLSENGGKQPVKETSAKGQTPPPLPDGAHARLLAGVRCVIPADEALTLLLSLHRAAAGGAESEYQEILRQTQIYLERLPQKQSHSS